MTTGKSICIGAIATIAALACAGPSSATTTTPTEQTVGFNVTPGNCRVIAVPVNNRPVLVMGTQPGYGVGQVTLVRATGGGSTYLEWAGVDFHSGVVRGTSSAQPPGVTIMYLDNDATLLATAAAGRVQVCNAGPIPHAIGYLTFVY